MPGRPGSWATSWPGATVLLGAAVGVTAVMDWSGSGPWLGYLALRCVVVASFVLVAVLLAREDGASGNTVLFGAATFALLVGWFRLPTPDPGPFVVFLLDNVMWSLLGWVVLRYPGSSLNSRWERAFVVVSLVWQSLGHTLVLATASGADLAEDWTPQEWRPTVAVPPEVHDRVVALGATVDLVVIVWFLVLLAGRLRSLGHLDRWAKAPVVAAACATAAPLITRLPALVVGGDDARIAQAIFQKAMLLAIPIAFVAVLVRERLACAAVERVVLRLGRAGGDLDAERLLGAALRDPGLAITRTAAHEPGTPSVVPSGAVGARTQHPVRSREGELLAVLDVDRALVGRPALLRSAVEAATAAVELARLRDNIGHAAADLAESQRRLDDSAADERRRLEQDLHDGAQQRLLALNLQVARLQAEGAGAAEIARRVRAEIHAASAEIRDLTRGVPVDALQRRGLVGAVGELAARMPFPVDLDVPAGRWPRHVETVAYFVVCEAAANVLKHAHARRVRVSVREADGRLVVVVTDDGAGGADLRRGTGLAGLVGRLHAVGGGLAVHSPVGGGTRLTAQLPLVAEQVDDVARDPLRTAPAVVPGGGPL